MELSEFFESFGKIQEMYQELKRQQKEFREQPSGELIEFIFMWHPEYLPKKIKLKDALNKTAQKYSDEVWEYFDLVEYRVDKGLPGKKKSNIPKLKTKVEAEKKLQEFLHLIPPENIEYAKQIHWESFEEEQQRIKFLLEIHRIMKKIIVEKFQDNVVKLDSDYLRLLDSYIHMIAYTFIDECYELLEN